MPVSTGSYTPGDMLLGGFPVLTRTVTIVSGAGVLARGTVLGKITTGGKYKTSLTASGDGSETPKRILAEAVDASSGDVVAEVYETGIFDASKLTIGTGHDADSVNAAFELADISMKLVTPA